MRIGVIVQARMSSKRFPGKVLHKIKGKPMLQYLLKGLSRCNYPSEVVVATSVNEDDDPIANFCKEYGTGFYRGPLTNVAGRFKEILSLYKFDCFVRICADSPLLDYRLVDHALNTFQSGDYDIVTNGFPCSFPSGQGVEVLCSKTFLNSYSFFNDEDDSEHVTTFFYRNSERFKIFNFVSNDNFTGCKLAIDTIDEMNVLESIINLMVKPHWEYSVENIVDLYNKIKLNR